MGYPRDVWDAGVFLVSAGFLLLVTAQAARAAGEASEDVILSEGHCIHGQTTFTFQDNAGFPAGFSGPNSLPPRAEHKETYDATLFLGVRLAQPLAFYLDPEVDQGFGLNNTLGLAGFTSGEAYKIGNDAPYFKLPRAFFRYVADLGGEAVGDSSAANQLGGSHAHDNLTITVGKFGAPDIFDTNKYAHDPRGDFLNWSIIEAGSFDYAADAWGFTYGAAVEWTQSWWTLRAGVFDLSRVPNSPHLVRGLGQFSVVTEAEERHQWWEAPGTAKLLLFADRGRMGNYDDAVALAQQTGAPPSTALVRRYATRPGVVVNLQQQIRSDLGAFLRASTNDGSKEAFEFTDINRSLSAGLSLQGAAWSRPNDVVGLAGVVNGISTAARRYFADGGLGILIGDGALPHYGAEKILETYYSLGVTEWAVLSLDYQYVNHPAYNPLRGPVSVFGVRVHAEF